MQGRQRNGRSTDAVGCARRDGKDDSAQHQRARCVSSERAPLISKLWIMLAVAIVVLSCTQDALAWGPLTHIGLGKAILDGLGALPLVAGAVLARHGTAYLYGNIAADIVFAKRLSRVKQFCHHWSTGLRLLDTATDDEGKAFGYGYLSHLAADTVAHGKFVPRQIALSNTSVNFGHFYWELRADAAQPARVSDLTEQVLDRDHNRLHDILAHHITDTLLSYELNRMLFNRLNAMAVHRTLRTTVSTWGHYSRWHLSAELLSGYHGEAIDRIVSVIRHGSNSAVMREDPNGSSALMQLRVRRREVRRLKRRGIPVSNRLKETSRCLAPESHRKVSVASHDPC